MTEPYQCTKCGETLIKSENKISKEGYKIPVNYYDGTISKRGEPHRCGKDIKQIQKPKPEYVSEKSKDLGDYMKNMARLGADKHWHLWVDGKYRGPVEYAPNDHKSWEGVV